MYVHTSIQTNKHTYIVMPLIIIMLAKLMQAYIRTDLYCPFIAECTSTSKISDLPGVTASVDGTLIDNADLFTFDDEDLVYCAPSASGSPIIITITFPEQIVLLEIDIHGNDRFLISNEYVTSFSVSYTRNDGTFVSYTRDTGSVVCINIIEVIM